MSVQWLQVYRAGYIQRSQSDHVHSLPRTAASSRASMCVRRGADGAVRRSQQGQHWAELAQRRHLPQVWCLQHASQAHCCPWSCLHWAKGRLRLLADACAVGRLLAHLLAAAKALVQDWQLCLFSIGNECCRGTQGAHHRDRQRPDQDLCTPRTRRQDVQILLEANPAGLDRHPAPDVPGVPGCSDWEDDRWQVTTWAKQESVASISDKPSCCYVRASAASS